MAHIIEAFGIRYGMPDSETYTVNLNGSPVGTLTINYNNGTYTFETIKGCDGQGCMHVLLNEQEFKDFLTSGECV